MSDSDLLFDEPAGSDTDLVFGGFGVTVALATATISMDDSPGLTALLGHVSLATPTISMDESPAFEASMLYLSQTQRPLVGTTHGSWQVADQTPTGRELKHRQALPMRSGVNAAHTHADPLPTSTAAGYGSGVRLRAGVAGKFAETERRHAAPLTSAWREGGRVKARTSGKWKNADLRRTGVTADWQERYRDRRPSHKAKWAEAIPLKTQHRGDAGQGLPLANEWSGPFKPAMRPPAGMYVPPVIVDPFEPCYIPDPHLVFEKTLPATPTLVFFCELHDDPSPEATVVVPVRKVYIVINTVALRRVDGNVMLPALSISLTIDVDSWTWGFTATLANNSTNLGNLRSSGDTPIELEARINDNYYRLLAENIDTSRQFGSNTIRVSGRGKNALLADPYSPILTFSNDEEKTAEQLMADVLTLNAVPLGWSLDWQISDWLVPAGAWNHQGAHMDGINKIAQAVGAYIQPHPTDMTLRVLHRYPSLPWDWGSVTPDFELPSAVTVQESIQYVMKPSYNRVYVSGTQQGILARVSKIGTGGDILAPMVVDPLITAALAGRQRGAAVLGDTGRQAIVGLRLPVLDETGVITPGQFVLYDDDGEEKLGIVRSTSVEANMVEAWQSITVETHE